MKKTKSRKYNYLKLSDYCDKLDISKCWDKTKKAEFEVEIDHFQNYYRIDNKLSEKLLKVARSMNVPAGTLIQVLIKNQIDLFYKHKINS